MQNLLELHKRRDFSSKLNAAIEFIRQNAKPFLKSLLFICGPVIILGAILMGEGYSRLLNLNAIFNPQNASALENDLYGLSISMISGMVFFLFAGTLLISAVYQYMLLYDQKDSGPITVSDVWNRVKRNVWSVLGTTILFTVIFFLIYLGLVLLVVGAANLSIFFAVLLGIGAFVVMVYLGVIASMVFVIQAFERLDPFSAYRRAMHLIKGKWWSTFGLLFVVVLIQYFVATIFMFPWYGVSMANSLHAATGGAEEPSLLYQIMNYLTLIIGMLGNNLVNAFPLLAISFQYFNLVEMKESKGLMNKIETFGQSDTTETDEETY